MSVKNCSVTFKMSQADLEKLDQRLRKLGFRTRSPYLRHLIQVANQQGEAQGKLINPVIISDFCLQLRRMNSALMKALTLGSTSQDQGTGEGLSTAVQDTQVLMRKVYKAINGPKV
ncbi:ribbon-helix-helix domain-containing protein [Magnetovibrio sp.]|uniref:ribbon-helix-helix domain-containing protein n=1 Tax=Magnetovibrio sp. TaxID=2024836 RepID=UPI002F929888